MLSGIIKRLMPSRPAREKPQPIMGELCLPKFRIEPVDGELSVLVRPLCGGGGGCPTVYQIGSKILIQGSPPTESDKASVQVSPADRAVVIPSSFFETVVQQILRCIPTDQIFGASSSRIFQNPQGPVVVKGEPAEDCILALLEIPQDEIVVSLPRDKFIKAIFLET